MRSHSRVVLKHYIGVSRVNSNIFLQDFTLNKKNNSMVTYYEKEV